MMSAKKILGEHIDYWSFLRENRIVIPQIQRDYAQGRKGREELRQKFLSAFKDALTGKVNDGGHRCRVELDFVYGIAEDGEFEPLDGQQRLTTTWLLCWYLAWRSGRLVVTCDENVGPSDVAMVLSNFNYRTRKSTGDFCRHLIVDGCRIKVQENGRLDDAIMNQTWFCDEWKYDPTIDAMLRMLSGMRKGQKGKDEYLTDDAIEKVFSGYKPEVLLGTIISGLDASFWPIMLWKYPLEQSRPGVENLYVKMNARGKPLSSFENFKADLSAFVKKESIELESQKSPSERFSHKIDVDWTDFFWSGRSRSPVRIDEIYFAFVNRFCLVKNAVRNREKRGIDAVEADPGFRFLYGNKGDDLALIYKSFDPYCKFSLSGNGCVAFGNVLDRLKSYCIDEINIDEINSALRPEWSSDERFDFVPTYLPNRDEPEQVEVAPTVVHLKFSQLTLKGRIAFGAFCRYFELLTKTDRREYFKSLLDWKRVVWNVLEDASVDNLWSMISGLRFFEDLGEHCEDVIGYLAREASFFTGASFSNAQVREECQKAKKITGERGDEWREQILKAERHPLLRGNISSIFDNDVSLDDFTKRVAAFYRVFPEKEKRDDLFYRKICRVLVSYDDCRIQRGSHWQFPVTEYVFMERLRERRGGDDFRNGLHAMLARACEAEFHEPETLLSSRKLGYSDWRYYFVEYCDVFLGAGIGYFDWNDSVKMPRYLIMKERLSGWHCNPFLLAVCKRKGLDESVWISSKGGGDGKLVVSDRIRLSYTDKGYLIEGVSVQNVKDGIDDGAGGVLVAFMEDRVLQACELVRVLRTVSV